MGLGCEVWGGYEVEIFRSIYQKKLAISNEIPNSRLPYFSSSEEVIEIFLFQKEANLGLGVSLEIAGFFGKLIEKSAIYTLSKTQIPDPSR